MVYEPQRTHLSIYGTIDTARTANAAQSRYSPIPTDTSIPSGTEDPFRRNSMVLTASTFLMMTVHRAAPTKSRIDPAMAIVDETRNPTVCLIKPLQKARGSAIAR